MQFIRTKVHKETITISLVFLGLVIMMFGIYLMQYPILPYIISTVGFFVFLVLVSEVGLKKFTRFSRLKKLETSQYITLLSALLVLLYSIINLPFINFQTNIGVLDTIINFMTSFAGGIFFFSGIQMIIEILRD